MQYMLLYHETPAEIARRADATEAPAYWASWTAYMTMLGQSGAFRGGNALFPAATATSVTVGSGGRAIEDGPFPDAREELGGYVIVEAADIDAAIALAEGAPCARAGRVEIRPVLPMASSRSDAEAAAA